LQRRTGLGLCLEKKDYGDWKKKEEDNQFDEIQSFDTSYKPRLQGTNKTPYLRSDHSEKIHKQKSRKKKQAWFLLNPFCNARGCVYWSKWNMFCNINSLFVWLVADGWCWFVLREKYCSLITSGWFVLRETLLAGGW
jgi:hypothetical protein